MKGKPNRTGTRSPAKSERAPPDLDHRLSADRAKVVRTLNDSREIIVRLDRYVALLREWQAKTNLIAPSTLPELWSRHIADSLQLLRLTPEATQWVDFGSGGGLPGMVIACALADRPGSRVHLVESNMKKAAFLREAARVTGAPAIIHAKRIEDFVDGFNEPVEIVTARALASLDNLIEKAYPLLQRGAEALFLKGQDVEAELTAASKYWTMEVDLTPSITDAEGRIVHIRSAEPVGVSSHVN